MCVFELLNNEKETALMKLKNNSITFVQSMMIMPLKFEQKRAIRTASSKSSCY